jgi:hypothetical protein
LFNFAEDSSNPSHEQKLTKKYDRKNEIIVKVSTFKNSEQ